MPQLGKSKTYSCLSLFSRIRFTEFHEKGIASKVYDFETLIKRKEILVSKIKTTYDLIDEAEYEKDVLDHMHYQQRDQNVFDENRIKEIVPFFQFSHKMDVVFNRISKENSSNLSA